MGGTEVCVNMDKKSGPVFSKPTGNVHKNALKCHVSEEKAAKMHI